MHITRVAWVIAVAAFSGGCAMTAPQYTASLENVQKLKEAGDYKAKVGPFTSQPDPGNANPISLRGSQLASPYEGSYAAYLAEAVKQELALAGRLAPDADLDVSGVLLKNDVSVGSFVTGTGDISARFVVKRKGEVRYDAVKTAHTEFESSFAGAVAIPRGQQEYPRLVQTLLAQLYADPAFVGALK